MDQQQALNVLAQAAQVAQSKGAFSLQEAALIAQAIAIFNITPEAAASTEAEEVEEVTSDSSES
jgi:hypothetical protein